MEIDNYLGIIVHCSCTKHREYHDFNGVHVYLRSIRISLEDNNVGFVLLREHIFNLYSQRNIHKKNTEF